MAHSNSVSFIATFKETLSHPLHLTLCLCSHYGQTWAEKQISGVVIFGVMAQPLPG